MSIKIIPKQVAIPRCRSTGKWYARAMQIGTVTTEQLAEELSHSSSVTQADLVAVLYSLAVAIRTHLLQSERVHLEGLGSLKVVVKSHVTDKKEDVNDKLIYSYRVLFNPDVSFVMTGTGEKGGRKGFYTKKLISGIKADKI